MATAGQRHLTVAAEFKEACDRTVNSKRPVTVQGHRT